MTTTMCYDPGEHTMPTEGKVALGPVGWALSSWSLREGMVGKGRAVPALWGSEEEQVWIILGEREEVEEAERKGFKEKKKAVKEM